MDTKKQAEKRQTQISKIIAAMKAGRHISLFDSAEFQVSEMHTCICYIRKYVTKGMIPGVKMCDKWCTNENDVRYKEYWFESL